MTRNREQKSSTSSSISMCKMVRPTHRNALFNRRATVPYYFQEVKENHWMVYNCTQGDNCSLYCFEASIAHWNDSNRDPNWLFMNADRIFRRKYRSICDSDVCGSIKRKHTHTKYAWKKVREWEKKKDEQKLSFGSMPRCHTWTCYNNQIQVCNFSLGVRIVTSAL